MQVFSAASAALFLLIELSTIGGIIISPARGDCSVIQVIKRGWDKRVGAEYFIKYTHDLRCCFIWHTFKSNMKLNV